MNKVAFCIILFKRNKKTEKGGKKKILINIFKSDKPVWPSFLVHSHTDLQNHYKIALLLTLLSKQTPH